MLSRSPFPPPLLQQEEALLRVLVRKGETRPPQEEALEEVRARKGPQKWSGEEVAEEASAAAPTAIGEAADAPNSAAPAPFPPAAAAAAAAGLNTALEEAVLLSWSLDRDSLLETSPPPLLFELLELFLFLLFLCSILADVSSVFALLLDGCLAPAPGCARVDPAGAAGASGFSIHQLDFPAPSFCTRTKRLCKERLWRIEFWNKRNINVKLLEIINALQALSFFWAQRPPHFSERVERMALPSTS